MGGDATDRAASLGHVVVCDPPAVMTAAQRWTCTWCGAAVIDYQGNVYGSAVERTCAEQKARYGSLRL